MDDYKIGSCFWHHNENQNIPPGFDDTDEIPFSNRMRPKYKSNIIDNSISRELTMLEQFPDHFEREKQYQQKKLDEINYWQSPGLRGLNHEPPQEPKEKDKAQDVKRTGTKD